MITNNTSTYATWIVTTEADEEGRSIRTLGSYTGHIDEIALFLAPQALFTLSFSRVKDSPKDSQEFTQPFQVRVSLDSSELKYEPDATRRAELVNSWLRANNRPVHAVEGTYFNSVVIIHPEAEMRFKLRENERKAVERRKQEAKQKALSKLTAEEIEILGLKK